MGTTQLAARIRSVDAAIAGRFRQYYTLASLSILLAGAGVLVLPPSNDLRNIGTEIAALPGAARLAENVHATPCAAHLPGLVLTQLFLSLMLGLCWLIFLGSILPRALAATRQVASGSVLPRPRPGLVDHGVQREDTAAPSRLLGLPWLALGLASAIIAVLPPYLVASGCGSMAGGEPLAGYVGWFAVLMVWALAFTAPHALLRLLQGSVLNQRWPSPAAAPHRPPANLRARARKEVAAIPLARDLPKAETRVTSPGPIEEDGTPVAKDTPRYAVPHELFKAMAALWASEVTQAARANDDYPTGFMHGRRQYYEFLAKTARKHEAALRHARRQNIGVENRRQLLKEQIEMCRKALSGARRHSSDLAPESPERRTTRFEIDTLRQHIADLEDRLHGK